MPSRENNNADTPEITLDQVQSLSSVLIPLIRDALRPEFHKLRDDFADTVAAQANRTQKEIDALAVRVGALETFRWKLWSVWTGASTVVLFLIEHFWLAKK